MDDGLDYATDVPVALCIIQRAVLGGALSALGVRLEDAAGSLSLCTDYSSHCESKSVGVRVS